MKKAIINWVEFTWSDNGEIKRARFDTQAEIDALIETVSKSPGFKYIGISRDVTYPAGFESYKSEAALRKMEYVERAAI